MTRAVPRLHSKSGSMLPILSDRILQNLHGSAMFAPIALVVGLIFKSAQQIALSEDSVFPFLQEFRANLTELLLFIRPRTGFRYPGSKDILRATDCLELTTLPLTAISLKQTSFTCVRLLQMALFFLLKFQDQLLSRGNKLNVSVISNSTRTVTATNTYQLQTVWYQEPFDRSISRHGILLRLQKLPPIASMSLQLQAIKPFKPRRVLQFS